MYVDKTLGIKLSFYKIIKNVIKTIQKFFIIYYNSMKILLWMKTV